MSSAQRRQVKETHNAHSEYSQSEDDGASQLRINQYLIRQEIGRGSFGAVHLATDQYDHEYAVKEFSKTRLRRRQQSNLLRRPRTSRPGGGGSNLPPHPSINAAMVRNSAGSVASPISANAFDLIREEIAVMKKLHHHNLASLIEVLDDPDDDSLFMVLEYCHKGVIMKLDMEDDVDPYDIDLCRLWFRDLLLGIEYLHAQGVVHRDIKPDNCLLTKDDILKVVDFGVSEMFEPHGDMRIHKTAGSPAFQAPELCTLKSGEVEGRPADIWSMGVTLFCLVFGRLPFRKNAVIELYQAICNDPLSIPEDCEASLKDLLERIFEKDPEKRISMNDLRVHPWVTKNGQDPLLSAEENCSELVSDPDEAELNAAITHNMGRVMAVMKAAKRFKGLIERNRPHLMDSILGSASRIVKPPLNMFSSDFHVHHSKSKPRAASEKDLEVAKRALNQQGDSKSAELITKLNSLPDKIKSAITQPLDNSPELPESPNVLRKVQTEPPDPEAHVRGHAHNPLEDSIYLGVGRGPSNVDGVQDDMVLSPQVVCESPPNFEMNVFEEAYEKEVNDIYKNQGRSATVYLTRRVQKSVGQRLGLFSTRPDDSSADAQGGSTLGSLFAKAASNTASTASSKGGGGLAGLVGKAMGTGQESGGQEDAGKQAT
ncbi:MAG: hypothetical protein Q9162_003253 [Coniocarpon cinnabarinum]